MHWSYKSPHGNLKTFPNRGTRRSRYTILYHTIIDLAMRNAETIQFFIIVCSWYQSLINFNNPVHVTVHIFSVTLVFTKCECESFIISFFSYDCFILFRQTLTAIFKYQYIIHFLICPLSQCSPDHVRDSNITNQHQHHKVIANDSISKMNEATWQR